MEYKVAGKKVTTLPTYWVSTIGDNWATSAIMKYPFIYISRFTYYIYIFVF